MYDEQPRIFSLSSVLFSGRRAYGHALTVNADDLSEEPGSTLSHMHHGVSIRTHTVAIPPRAKRRGAEQLDREAKRGEYFVEVGRKRVRVLV